MSDLKFAIGNPVTDYTLNYLNEDRTGNDFDFGYNRDKIRERINYFKKLYNLIKPEIDNEQIKVLIENTDKKKVLNRIFESEIEKNKKIISGSHIDIRQFFQTVANYIIDINYKNISFELTQDNSIFFNILLNNELKSHIEIYINENINNVKDILFSLYKEKKCIMSGYGKLENIVKELNEYI